MDKSKYWLVNTICQIQKKYIYVCVLHYIMDKYRQQLVGESTHVADGGESADSCWIRQLRNIFVPLQLWSFMMLQIDISKFHINYTSSDPSPES